nr:hypothetical protein [Tanacetum cinerariifolium]
MSWFSRCSWYGGPFNDGNCRHCTNVSFGDEPVYDSNPNSYNQTLDFSNPPPHHNYEIDSRSDTRAAFQAEFAKIQQNFVHFMAQLRCSNCGGLFNGGNYPSCSIVGSGNEFVHDLNPLPYYNTLDFSYQPPQHHVDTYSCELCGNDSHYGYDCPPWFPLIYEQEPCYNQNLNDNHYPQNSPRNEELNIILEKESDEFIKSSVEDLVLIPSESGDTSGNDKNIKSKDSYDSNLDEPNLLVTPFFDANKDECFDSGGDVDKINDFEDGYYDSKGDILYLESLLNDDLVYHDPSIPAMSVASILEGFTDEPPLEENDDLFDSEPKNNDWQKILYDALIDDLITDDKVFDPGIHDQNFSPTYVSLPFEDRHYLFFTYVVRIFLPHISYPVVSHFILSSGSEDTIFDLGIFAFYFSHRCGTFICFNVCLNILNEISMEIFPSTCFTPNITMIWGESS